MLIELDNITKYYYSSTSVTLALKKINLGFDKGEFVAITGESGSGKSTLLNVISGLTGYDEGELYIDGTPTSSFDKSDWENFRRDKIGFVFQDYNLIDKYSVLENVMSAMLIRGFNKKTAVKRAVEIIGKVGLEKFISQRAAKLSSGQKQRLAIARALAKDTDIIVADEPTGNLDSETGRQIIELFAELAKDKLVIMVTHNYEQAAGYVTRQIRLYDGSVVSDDTIRVPEHKREKKPENAEKCKKAATAMRFVVLNIKRQPFLMLFIAVFMLVIVAASFVFMGEIYINYDDINTRIYDNSVYYNEDDCRIVVKKSDGSTFSDEDTEKLESLNHVEYVDKYDAVTDINYAFEEGIDYYVDAEYQFIDGYDDDGNQIFLDNNSIQIINYDRFVHSVTCISEDDLKEGKLPQSRYEIVLYEGDDSRYQIGDTITFYFENKNLWNNEHMEHEFTVCGLLKEQSTQVYFSEDYCNMLSYSVYMPELRINGAWCYVYHEYAYNKQLFIPYINEELENDVIQVSRNLDCSISDIYTGSAHFRCEKSMEPGVKVLLTSDTTEIAFDGEINTLELVIADTYNVNGNMFVGVNENTFRKLWDEGSCQCSVYITNYAYTDKVLKELDELGYDAISTIRAASIEYDNQKLYNRMMFLVISIAALVVLAVMGVFITYSMLKIKKKDFSILRSMGADPRISRYITIFEVNIFVVAAMIITVAAAFILGSKGLKPINSIIMYMDWWKYIVFAVYNFVLAQIAGLLFNSYIAKHLRLAGKTK